MKNLFSGILLALASIASLSVTYAQQVSPYSVPPKWRFGYNGGMDFPTSGAPVVAPGFANPDAAQENSTTMVDTAGNIVFSSNSFRLFDKNNTQLQTINGATSATAGCLSVPDPIDPFNQFYLITANSENNGTGGGGHKGINAYHITRNGDGTLTVTGPTLLASPTEVMEGLTTSSDGNGGYWLIAHQLSGKQYWSWHITSTGLDANKVISTGNGSPGGSYLGSLKISKCQTRIAFISANKILEIYEWNMATGTLGGLVRNVPMSAFWGYGIEFSPDATLLYYTIYTGPATLAQVELSTGTITTLSTTPVNDFNQYGSMQLGPDDKIYVTDAAFTPANRAVYVGVINSPNIQGTGCGYDPQGFTLKPNNASNTPREFLGIVNESWINPTLALDTIGNCKSIKMTYDFKTYYRQIVSVTTGSEEWDLGDGNGFQTGLGASPTFTFTPGPHTVTLKVTDASCSQVWTASMTFTVNDCGGTTNPPTCNLTLDSKIAPVADFTLSENDPSIITFDGTGSTGFDNSPTADPKLFYWIKSDGTTPKIADAFATTETAQLTFQHGTTLPEGIYKIYLIVKQGLCSDIDSVEFTVTHSTTPICNFDLVPVIKTVEDILIDESTPVSVTFDGTSSVFNPSTVDPEKYYWIIGGIDTNQAFSKNQTSSLTFAYNGKGGNHPQGGYDIYLVTREGLCLEYTKVHLNVTFFFLPNLVTPNGDGKNDKFFITNTPGRFNVLIFNRWGQQVFKEEGYTDGWDLPNVSDGIYFYEVTDTKLSKTYKGWINVIKKQ